MDQRLLAPNILYHCLETLRWIGLEVAQQHLLHLLPLKPTIFFTPVPQQLFQ
jgi:hypothetical protein